ncbi:MAG: glycosyltransferase family 1 protein [bacterium]|nr:glycosyltransferase family 1 protein [bacterium]
MKVAFITDHFPPKTDGVVTRLLATVAQLRAMDCEITVLTGMPFAAEKIEGLGAKKLRSIKLPFIKERYTVLPFNQCQRALREFKPDVIHVLNMTWALKQAAHYAGRHNVPLIISIHSDYFSYFKPLKMAFIKRWLLKELLAHARHADLCLCTSTYMRQQLMRKGVRNNKIWPPGIVFYPADYPPDKIAQARATLCAADAKDPLLIYVGRLSLEKNLLSLVHLLRAIPKLQLAFIGVGEQKTFLQEQFSQTKTIFTGKVTPERLKLLYQAADALILPSTTETLGLVLLEAMSCGCPVIAAHAGGVTDLVEHNKTGLLYAPEKASNLVSVVLQMLNDQTKRESMRQAAYQFARSLDWEKATLRLLADYQDVINSCLTETGKPASI